MDGRVRAGIASSWAALAVFFAGAVGSSWAKAPTVFDPVVEAKNFSITLQRQAIYDTPDYQAKLAAVSIANGAAALVTQASDPERLFVGDLCWSAANGCAGDIRLDDWANRGYGLVRPVLFTARDGATLSGHVWATVAGPARRPAIVITNRSVQANEQLYWYAAQSLAKAGYVVLTFDPQGQGQSDTFGQAPDAGEGVPAQTDGRPFYDGTEDALNCLLSTPSHPYEPVPSCTTGTSHAPKQRSRVARGLDAAFDPYWQLIDCSEISLAGHSYGAAGVSYIAQWDPRVKAVVAWDNLGGPGPREAPVPGTSGGSGVIGELDCPADPAACRVVPIAKPGLGIAADYGLPPAPNLSLPPAEGKSPISLAYSKAGVDPSRDGNAFSFYYYSRLDIHGAGGGVFDCEDLRDGCRGTVPASADGYRGTYSYVAIDTSPDSVAGAGRSLSRSSSLTPCGRRSRPVRVRVRPIRGHAVRLVKVYLDGRLVLKRSGRALRSVVLPAIPGRARHRLVVWSYPRSGRARRSVVLVYGCAHR